jgi:hypothetical protein
VPPPPAVSILDFKVQIRSGQPRDEWEGVAGPAILLTDGATGDRFLKDFLEKSLRKSSAYALKSFQSIIMRCEGAFLKSALCRERTKAGAGDARAPNID